MATPINKEAYEYAAKFLKEYDSLSHVFAYPKKEEYKMYHCIATERKMDDLRRCGCNQCYDEYRRLERDYYRDYSRDYYIAPQLSAPVIAKVELKMTETKSVEEPKNYAHKLLVDQLKAQQSALTSKNANIDADKNSIKSYQGYLKTKKVEKLAIETKIKELSVALKKLGHRE